MSTTATKIVIDTNVFITIIGKKSPTRWIFDKIITGEFVLCVSSELLLEYEEILTKKANIEVARNVIDFLLISPFVQKTDIYFNWSLIQDDPDDDKFIDCYLSSGAEYLLTNDKHFNVICQIDFPKINIISLTDFENKYR
jgi:putative PIN family toxin of toxin-antitoxin system